MKNNSEIPNYYAILPAEVRYCENISSTEKLLYAEITALSNKTGECWATNGYFAKLYKVCEKTISRSLQNLAEQGFMEIKYFYNKDKNKIIKRIIKIKKIKIPTKSSKKQNHMDKNVQVGGQKCPDWGDKNVPENNTSINIKLNTTVDQKSNLSTIEQQVFNSDSNSKKNNPVYMATINYINEWNEFAKKHQLAEVLGPTTIRLKNIKLRLKESNFNFTKILNLIENSDFWLYQSFGGQGVNFDFITKNEDGYLKIIENSKKKIAKSTADEVARLIEKQNKIKKGVNNATIN